MTLTANDIQTAIEILTKVQTRLQKHTIDREVGAPPEETNYSAIAADNRAILAVMFIGDAISALSGLPVPGPNIEPEGGLGGAFVMNADADNEAPEGWEKVVQENNGE